MLQLEYTPYTWPFIISLIITVALSIYAFRHQYSPAATTFAWLMVAISVWTLCYLLELLSVTLAAKTFWAQMKYLGSATGPLLLFILSLQLTKKEHWLTRPVKIFLWGFVMVTILIVFTNDLHHWYWTEIEIVPGFPETQVEHGFYFWVYAIAPYLFVLVSVILYFDYYRRTPGYFRKQAFLLALAGFIPLAGRILEDFLGIDLFPKVDNIILLLLISAILFTFAIFKYGALNVVHIAHDLVIKNIQAGIIVLDNAERVVELNPYARTLVENTQSNPIGRPFSQLWANSLGLDIQAGSEKEIILQQDGKQRAFSVQISSIKEAKGEQVGHSLVLFDVTVRKQAEAELRQAKEATETANQALSSSNFELETTNLALAQSNAELEAFAHTVAHDLKNPLSLVIGFSELLADMWQELPTDETGKYLATIKQTGQKMNSIVNELLLLASVRQISEIATEPLEMAVVITEVQTRLSTMIADYQGELVLPESWLTAVGYAPWVEEVWVNYISNALKYGGGPPRIELGATNGAGETVCFWVKDNGPGLSVEQRAQLFTEFTRLHKTRAQGHGLGLSIVQRIVEKLGGEVGVRSEPGQGSEFYFTLPGQ